MNSNSPISSPAAATAQRPPAPDSQPRFPFSLLIVVCLAVVLAATLVTLVLPESFASTARIKIERDHPDIRGLSDQPAAPAPYDPYFLQTQFEIIQSETVLGRVIEARNLNEVWGRRYYDGSKLKTPETLVLLRSRLDLRPVRNTALLDIRVFSENAGEAAELANEMAKSYKAWRVEKTYELMKDGLDSLKKRAAEMDERIAKCRQELANSAESAENTQRLDLKKLTYLAKQKEFEQMNELRWELTRRVYLEDTDLRLPRNEQVMIIESAVPGVKPIRPNVPRNIVLSILLGGLLGLILATLVYLLQRRAFRRQAGVAGTTNLRALRTVLRILIALVVGVIVGYNCAMPMSVGSLLLTQLFVLLGGIAIAFVELKNPSPIPISPTAPAESQLKDLPRTD
jgi:capsular polysaccharide biosynthesis protein